MSLEYAILGFLSEGDQSGYDLKTRCFDIEAHHLWTADQAQVYRTLERLELKEFVASRSIPQRGKPDRRVYRITAKGRDALSDWLTEPLEPSPPRDPLLVQLRFSESIPPDRVTDSLRETRDRYQQRLTSLRNQAAEHGRAHRRPTRHSELVRLTIDAALATTRSQIDRIDDCIEFLHAEQAALSSGSSQRQLFGLPSEPGGTS